MSCAFHALPYLPRHYCHGRHAADADGYDAEAFHCYAMLPPRHAIAAIAFMLFRCAT